MEEYADSEVTHHLIGKDGCLQHGSSLIWCAFLIILSSFSEEESCCVTFVRSQQCWAGVTHICCNCSISAINNVWIKLLSIKWTRVGKTGDRKNSIPYNVSMWIAYRIYQKVKYQPCERKRDKCGSSAWNIHIKDKQQRSPKIHKNIAKTLLHQWKAPSGKHGLVRIPQAWCVRLGENTINMLITDWSTAPPFSLCAASSMLPAGQADWCCNED